MDVRPSPFLPWNFLTLFSSSVLSAFEESSAACISDMLRQVSNGAYLDAIRMAEKFILHVEVLFGTIDDLEWIFAGRGVKGLFRSLFLFLYSSSSLRLLDLSFLFLYGSLIQSDPTSQFFRSSFSPIISPRYGPRSRSPHALSENG